MKTAKLTAILAVGLALLFASPASAQFSIEGFTASTTTSAAGAHPDVTTDLAFGHQLNPFEWTLNGNVREMSVELPPGFVGNPSVIDECTQSQFIQEVCPHTAQVGTASILLTLNRDGGPAFGGTLPVYNMQPRNASETAEFAFTLGSFITIHLPIEVRTDGDYGLTAVDTGVARSYGLAQVDLTVWGVPGDPSHDSERVDMSTVAPVPPTGQPRVPFYTNPTNCTDEDLTLTAIASSYQEPTRVSQKTTTLPRRGGDPP